MGRLINTEELHNVVMKRKREYGKLATLVDNIVAEMVGKTLTANAISIPKEATNGEIIKAIFPNVEVVGIEGLEGLKCVAVSIGLGTSYFALDWWNELYKRN